MTKLDRLEEEIYEAVYGSKPSYVEDGKLWNAVEDRRRQSVKSSAQVALRWIEKAYMVHEPANYNEQAEFRKGFKTWITENYPTSDPVKEEDTGIIASNVLVSPPNEPETK